MQLALEHFDGNGNRNATLRRVCPVCPVCLVSVLRWALDTPSATWDMFQAVIVELLQSYIAFICCEAPVLYRYLRSSPVCYVRSARSVCLCVYVSVSVQWALNTSPGARFKQLHPNSLSLKARLFWFEALV